jgi:hypothetical protein
MSAGNSERYITTDVLVIGGGVQGKCQFSTCYHSLNSILTFRRYHYYWVRRRRDFAETGIPDRYSRYSVMFSRHFLSPFTRELLCRETEVIGQVTKRIWVQGLRNAQTKI